MDEAVALARISDLENQLRALRQDRLNYIVMIENYRAFVDAIPKTLPNGEEVTAYKWLEWARKELGYDTIAGSGGFADLST